MGRGRRPLVGGLAALAVLLLAAPALAHPLGLPATARIVRTAESEVTVRWAAQPDDVVALAVAAGLAPTGLPNGPDGRPEVPAEAALQPADDEALAASDELSAYVAQRVTVVVNAGSCVGTLRRHPTVQVHGVEVVFACPGPAHVADVTIGLLHELDERYRTLAGSTGPDGEVTTFFAASAPTQRLSLLEVGTLPSTASSERPEITRGADGGADFGADVFGGVGRLDELLISAIEQPAGGFAWILGLLVAAGVGAAHALAPGHGKAIAAAYLVGERGRRRDAVVLSSAVAAMHTGSVLVLGFALWRTASTPDAARLGAAIEAAAGVTFVALGAWLLWTRRRDAPHDHDHGHGHGHASVALAERCDNATDRATTSRVQRLVALGAAGGLLPSPSALVVLLTALFLDRTGYGLALVAAFSVGMAVVLTSVGFAVLAGRDLAVRRLPERLHGLLHAAPALGAVAVVVLGGIILARGVLRLT